MNTIINNNRKLLNKRDKLRNRLGGYDANKKTEYNLPKASAKQLERIRKRMQHDRKLWWIKVSVVTLLVFLLLVGLAIKLLDILMM